MHPVKRTGRARTAGILATVALAAVLSGCGSAGDILSSPTGGASPSVGTTASASAATSTAAPTAASLPAGWTRTTVAVDGYSIGTPKDWSPVALGGQDIDALIAGFKTTNPELAGILQQARDSGQSFSFMAIATDPALIGNTGFAPNVNVIISDSQGYDSAFIATASVIQLKKLASLEGEIQDIAVALPADPGAHRVRYHLKFSASLTTVATLYLITRGSKTYNITVSAVDSQLAGLEDSFLTIARSFTFVTP